MSDHDDKQKTITPPELISSIERTDTITPRTHNVQLGNWFMGERVRTLMAATFWQELWINILLVVLVLGFGYSLLYFGGVR